MNYSFFVDFTATPKVHLSTILFYVVYLAIMWPLALAMYRSSKSIPNSAAKYLPIANILLVAGDSAMFLCWLLVFFEYSPLTGSDEGSIPVVPIGIFSTSITMSLYYLYLLLFFRKILATNQASFLFTILYILFFVRLLLHYNPSNIWLNMDEGKKDPNYSAWLRNIPLFLYGLTTVALILAKAKKKIEKPLRVAMIALLFSFFFYAVDIFLSHLIPNRFIWITYTLKTIAYIIAAFQMRKYINNLRSNSHKQPLGAT